MKGLTQEATRLIIQRPKHIDQLANSRGGAKILRIAETLKIMDRTQTMCYDDAEFAREFSSNKGYPSYMKKRLQGFGIKKPRIVKDNGKVYIWSNDEK